MALGLDPTSLESGESVAMVGAEYGRNRTSRRAAGGSIAGRLNKGTRGGRWTEASDSSSSAHVPYDASVQAACVSAVRVRRRAVEKRTAQARKQGTRTVAAKVELDSTEARAGSIARAPRTGESLRRHVPLEMRLQQLHRRRVKILAERIGLGETGLDGEANHVGEASCMSGSLPTCIDGGSATLRTVQLLAWDCTEIRMYSRPSHGVRPTAKKRELDG
ncbi:hypothetical protein CCMA1212_002785 [Trichoderma ghanense]|uniref:Uncharacterized protein n=1 Tax=Trichoderma ghanense TaxID=65468 RepID=A0ABY2HDD1_9HYPO